MQSSTQGRPCSDTASSKCLVRPLMSFTKRSVCRQGARSFQGSVLFIFIFVIFERGARASSIVGKKCPHRRTRVHETRPCVANITGSLIRTDCNRCPFLYDSRVVDAAAPLKLRDDPTVNRITYADQGRHAQDAPRRLAASQRYPDPAVQLIDQSFARYRLNWPQSRHCPRLSRGEGPCGSATGVTAMSDIPKTGS